VGYNPFRKKVQHRGDLAIVITVCVIVALLVLWAALPR
jgi:hypothetical protein